MSISPDRRIILESPFGSPNKAVVQENIRYARACMRDSLLRGEGPFASHLLYTQPGVLDDNDPHSRTLGIEAGLLWGHEAHATVVYTDRGVTSGMKLGIERAIDQGRKVEYREVPDWPLALMLLPKHDTEQPLGDDDATIQITYMGHDADEEPQPMALFTCRAKDQDLTAEQMQELGEACLRTAARMFADADKAA